MRRGCLVAALVLAGCGGQAPPAAEPDQRPAVGFAEPTIEPGVGKFDILALPLSEQRRLRKLAGDRRDYRVPRALLAGLAPGEQVEAAMIRVWNELYPDSPKARRLNDGQRAVFALMWADAEILNGGLDQLWFNSAGYVGPDLVAAARRVGAEPYAEVFADAQALFPGGRIPRDRALRQRQSERLDFDAVLALDDRYSGFQYRRETALGRYLHRYILDNLEEFTF